MIAWNSVPRHVYNNAGLCEHHLLHRYIDENASILCLSQMY